MNLRSRIIAFASRLEDTTEFAKWTRTSAGTLSGELGNGLRFRATRGSWSAPGGNKRDRTLKVSHPTGAQMTISKESNPGKAIDHRQAYVDLLDSGIGDNEGTMANARAHRAVNDTFMSHLRKNNTALRYTATPLSDTGKARGLDQNTAGAKARLNAHYEKAAKRHGFDPIPGALGPGHSGSVLVPRAGFNRGKLGPTGDWTPGDSDQSRRVADSIADHANPEAAIIRRNAARDAAALHSGNPRW